MILKSYEDSLWALPTSKRFAFLKAQTLDGHSVTTRIINNEYELLLNIKTAATTVRAVLKSDDQLFRLRFVWPNRVGVIDLSWRNAGKLIAALKLDGAELQSFLPGHCFNPYVNLLLKQKEEFSDLEPLLFNLKQLANEDAMRVVDRLNGLVEALRTEGRSQEMLRNMDDWTRRVRKRFSGASRYVNALFNRHSRVLAIRLDLGYCMEETASQGMVTSSMSLADVKAHMAKFDRFVRENYPAIGHMHCREYGLLSGYHFHVLYFLNRNLVQRDVHIARELGERWKNVITEGRGRYYNCNAEDYPRKGVGTIQYDDYAKRDILLNSVVAYLTKSDFWLFHEAGGKTFVKGLMPAGPSSLGRPRKNRQSRAVLARVSSEFIKLSS